MIFLLVLSLGIIASGWDLTTETDTGVARVTQVEPSKWPIEQYRQFSALNHIKFIKDAPGQVNFEYRQYAGPSKDNCSRPQDFGYSTFDPKAGDEIVYRSYYDVGGWDYHQFLVKLCLRRYKYDFACSNDNPYIYYKGYTEVWFNESMANSKGQIRQESERLSALIKGDPSEKSQLAEQISFTEGSRKHLMNEVIEASSWKLNVTYDSRAIQITEVDPDKWPLKAGDSFTAQNHIKINRDIGMPFIFSYKQISGPDEHNCKNVTNQGNMVFENRRVGDDIVGVSNFTVSDEKYNRFTVEICGKRGEFDTDCGEFYNPFVYFEGFLEIRNGPQEGLLRVERDQ